MHQDCRPRQCMLGGEYSGSIPGIQKVNYGSHQVFEHKELVMCDVYWCPLLHISTSTLPRTSRRVSTELWRCWSEPSTDPPLTYGARRVWYELNQCWSKIYFSIKTVKHVDLSFLLVSCERAVICLHRRLSWRLETICLSLTQERTTLEMKVSSHGLPPRLLIFSDYRSLLKTWAS